MNINRHNYEEVFLLYVDKELTAANRTMVENFVIANPDLKEELELLKQTSFATDITIDAAFLESLLKPVAEETIISEEQLLLFVDDELNAHEAKEVRKSIAVSEYLQKEVQLLQRSKLVADTSIVFPNKSILLRQETHAKVFYMSAVVRKWSAAAAVILLLGSGVWLLMNNKKLVPPVVKNNPSQIISEPYKKEKKEVVTPAPVINEMIVQQQKNTIKPTTTSPLKQKNTPASPVIKRNEIVLVNNDNKNQLPVPDKKTNEQERIANVEPIVTKPKINLGTESNKTTTTTVPIITNTTKPQASYAAYNNDNEVNEEDNSLLNEKRQRSSGLKGFLKKAKRTLERRTGVQSGDSQVRFAMFAVNTQ